MSELTMAQALNLAMRQEMEKDERVVLIGEDVGVDGGIFRITEGLLDRFGEERVIDSPLAESAIVGVSVGMAVVGLRTICELQFSGFGCLGFRQFESHASRMRWRSRARLQPVAEGTIDDHRIVARLMLPLCVAFDHRVADGAQAARLAGEIASTLTNPEQSALMV